VLDEMGVPVPVPVPAPMSLPMPWFQVLHDRFVFVVDKYKVLGWLHNIFQNRNIIFN
jgi:hypothetical protein